MNNQGTVAYKAQTRAYNNENFGDFIRYLIVELLNKSIYGEIYLLENVAFIKQI